MAEIIPAIIANDFNELEGKLSQVEGLVSWAQIDVMDGVFTPPTTFNNPSELNKLDTKINLEAHLMIDRPENTIEDWINSSVKRILVHYESTREIGALIKQIKKADKEVGIALKMKTELDMLDLFIANLDVIQLMGIDEIGYYGHSFNPIVLEKIKALHERYPNVTIEIDGGVSLDNAPQIIKAGAHNLVAGSAIFKSGNVEKTIKAFQNIT